MKQTEAISKVLAEVERQYQLILAGAPGADVDVVFADAIIANVTTQSGGRFSIITKTLAVGQL